jgi:hypothetical protein
MPRHWNTVSVMMAPARRAAISSAVTVVSERDQGVPERVPDQDPSRRDALRPGEAHVVRVQHLEQGRAGVPRPRGVACEAERDGRQDEMAGEILHPIQTGELAVLD